MKSLRIPHISGRTTVSLTPGTPQARSPADWTVAAVDGDMGILNLYQHLTALTGGQFWAVQRGDEALTRLQQAPPDVLMMEIWLPRLDGMSLLESLSASRTLLHTQVLVISGSPKLSSLADALYGLGVTQVLSKPFDPARVLTFLRSQQGGQHATVQRMAHPMAHPSRLSPFPPEMPFVMSA